MVGNDVGWVVWGLGEVFPEEAHGGEGEGGGGGKDESGESEVLGPSEEHVGDDKGGRGGVGAEPAEEGAVEVGEGEGYGAGEVGHVLDVFYAWGDGGVVREGEEEGVDRRVGGEERGEERAVGGGGHDGDGEGRVGGQLAG